MTAGYAEDLLALARADHGHETLSAPRATVRRANTTCGDDIELDVDHDGERVTALAQRTRGCAFLRGSASLLVRTLTGRSVRESRELAALVRRDLLADRALPAELAALENVRVYPARARCALLPWESLEAALAERTGTATR